MKATKLTAIHWCICCRHRPARPDMAICEGCLADAEAVERQRSRAGWPDMQVVGVPMGVREKPETWKKRE